MAKYNAFSSMAVQPVNEEYSTGPHEYVFQGTFSNFAIGVEEAGRSLEKFAKAVRRFEACPYCQSKDRPTETLPGNRHCPECKGFR